MSSERHSLYIIIAKNILTCYDEWLICTLRNVWTTLRILIPYLNEQLQLQIDFINGIFDLFIDEVRRPYKFVPITRTLHKQTFVTCSKEGEYYVSHYIYCQSYSRHYNRYLITDHQYQGFDLILFSENYFKYNVVIQTC